MLNFQIYIPLITVIFLIFLSEFPLYALIAITGGVDSLTTPFIIETVYIVCNIDKIYTVDGGKIAEVLRLYFQ